MNGKNQLSISNDFLENFDRKNLKVSMESREQGLSIDDKEIEFPTKFAGVFGGVIKIYVLHLVLYLCSQKGKKMTSIFTKKKLRPVFWRAGI